MPVPLHRSFGTKGALAISFSAFLVPVLFDAFLLPTSVHNLQPVSYHDMSAMQQAMFDAPKPRIAARDVKSEMGYVLGNPHLAARQEEDPVDEDATTRRPATRTRDNDDRPTSRPDDGEPESKPKPKPKQVNACAWNRMIEGTNTTPLWLCLGLSAGSIAGILIAAFTSYQYGKASKGGGGAAGGGMGGAPPPMY